MSKRTSTLVVRGLLALGLAVLSFTHSAQAATVYSDFGAPPTIYSSTNGWLVAGSASPYGSYSAAMPFTLGVTRKIDYSSVAVALYSGTKTFFVDIRKDCSGVPCPTAMYTWPATVATYSYGSCCA